MAEKGREGCVEEQGFLSGCFRMTIKEVLIHSSFRPKRSGEPESSLIGSAGDWIPACAGMTEK
jgi:hypothetical protein